MVQYISSEVYGKSVYPYQDRSGSSTWIWWLVFFVVLIVISAIVIAYLLTRKSGNTEGEKCQKNEDCAAGHFCGGDFKCHTGSNGVGESGFCEITSQCEVNLVCIPPLGETKGRCVDPTQPINNSLPSFDNKLISTIESNKTLYLHITEDGNGSRWMDFKPNYSYSYSENSKILSVSSTPEVIDGMGSKLNGDVKIFTDGTLTTGSASTIIFFTNTNSQTFFSDSFGNIFSIELPTSITNPLGLFLDRNHYPDVEDTVTATDAFINLVDCCKDETDPDNPY